MERRAALWTPQRGAPLWAQAAPAAAPPRAPLWAPFLTLGWFALRPTSQSSAAAVTVQASNAQGLANMLRATPAVANRFLLEGLFRALSLPSLFQLMKSP